METTRPVIINRGPCIADILLQRRGRSSAGLSPALFVVRFTNGEEKAGIGFVCAERFLFASRLLPAASQSARLKQTGAKVFFGEVSLEETPHDVPPLLYRAAG